VSEYLSENVCMYNVCVYTYVYVSENVSELVRVSVSYHSLFFRCIAKCGP
jgi:hypothetical protein